MLFHFIKVFLNQSKRLDIHLRCFVFLWHFHFSRDKSIKQNKQQVETYNQKPTIALVNVQNHKIKTSNNDKK